MKAITISQPYASYIADGRKFVENRKWPIKYTGPLAIHAGQGTQYMDAADLVNWPTGVVIAVVDLVGCLSLQEVRDAYEQGNGIGQFTAAAIAEIAEHLHTEGPFCWLLKNVRKLESPIAARGRLGLWEFDESRLGFRGDW